MGFKLEVEKNHALEYLFVVKINARNHQVNHIFMMTFGGIFNIMNCLK